MSGIPHAFVVANGKVAWMGHPMQLTDEVIGDILTGTPLAAAAPVAAPSLADLSFGQLGKIGLAFTWPLLLIALAALVVLVVEDQAMEETVELLVLLLLISHEYIFK